MNFYRLRFLNTFLLFLIGILTGTYLSPKANILKDLFRRNEYIPVYWGKKTNKNEDYTPVYLNKFQDVKNIEKQIEVKKPVNLNNDARIFVESVALQNPIDDDYDFILVATDEKKEEVISLDDFVKNPESYKDKTISGKLVLLKGERETKVSKLYFLYNISNSAFYLQVDDEGGIIKNYEDFKIGYYYDVVFLSAEGKVDSGNKLISIEQSGDKTKWATEFPAF